MLVSGNSTSYIDITFTESPVHHRFALDMVELMQPHPRVEIPQLLSNVQALLINKVNMDYYGSTYKTPKILET